MYREATDTPQPMQTIFKDERIAENSMINIRDVCKSLLVSTHAKRMRVCGCVVVCVFEPSNPCSPVRLTKIP